MVLAVESGSNFLPWGTVLAFAAIGLVMAAIWLWSLVDALRVSDRQ